MNETILGDFDHASFPNIYLDGTLTLPMLQVTKVHEKVHQQLEYASSHGLFVTFLLGLQDTDSLSHPCMSDIPGAIDALARSEFLVQEGCATFLALQVLAALQGPRVAATFVRSIPDDYRFATVLYQECLAASDGSGAVGREVAQILEVLAKSIGLASLNGSVCTLFADIDSFSRGRLLEALKEDSPNRRLFALHEFLSDASRRSEYVFECKRAITKAAGPEIDYFDREFLMDLIRRDPLGWDHLHAKIDLEACHHMVLWLGKQGIIEIDPSYATLLTTPERWSPLILSSQWEERLGLTEHLRDRLMLPGAMSKEAHAALVHTVNYSIRDTRPSVPYFRAQELAAAVRAVGAGRLSPLYIIRTLYVPQDAEMPTNPDESISLTPRHRIVADVAVHDGLKAPTETLFAMPLTPEEVVGLLPDRSRGVVLLQYFHYELMQVAGENEVWHKHGVDCYVFFKPGEVDLIQELRRVRSPQRGSYGVCGTFRYGEIEVPQIICVEGIEGRANVRFFCLADDYLRSTYGQALAAVATRRDPSGAELSRYRQCAVEACFGIGSVFDRMLGVDAA